MPYIPEEHKKFNVLPYCTEHGGEVFDYPSKLVDKLGDYFPEDVIFIPYGYKSYEEYFDYLREYREKTSDEEAKKLFDLLDEEIKKLNRKEEWSICRYVGKPMSTVHGLEPKQCYYWPCCKDDPHYHGVIDNEEFTTYWYPTDPEIWEVVWDPTGMAQRTLDNPDKRNSREAFNDVMNQLNGDDWTDI